jgi:hypothetical protein
MQRYTTPKSTKPAAVAAAVLDGSRDKKMRQRLVRVRPRQLVHTLRTPMSSFLNQGQHTAAIKVIRDSMIVLTALD